MGEPSEPRVYSPKEIFQDCVDNFSATYHMLEMLVENNLSGADLINKWKVYFGEHSGVFLENFSVRTLRKYGSDSLPKFYEDDIEELDSLISSINSLVNDFFVKENKNENTDEDRQVFLDQVTSLVKNATNMAKATREKFNASQK
jgi:hypothetical protein